MRRSRKAALVFGVGGVLIVSVFATVAGAKPFFGTRGDDVINGTNRRDLIMGRAGNDTLNGFGRRDVIFGGWGNDTVNAGDGNDLVFGGPGDDTLNGDAGNDRIFAQRGVDTVNGGPGNDTFHVRDGEPDHVTCGQGYDVVRADYKDVVANDCELVIRRRAREKSRVENDD